MDKHIREIIGKCDDEAPVLDMVIKDIFMSCDTHNEGVVPVSKLMDFIMPFLNGNIHALEELQKSLDPNNQNPSIDIDTFYKDMNEWTLKISSADHLDDDDIHNVTPRDFERVIEKDMSFLQSTPRSSFGHHLLKGYVESGISNLSIASSINENQSMYFPDRTVLEEQIQQLQHQNRQVTEELARVKTELTATSEQNEALQGDLDKVLKKLANEQKLNAQLQSDRTVEDDCEEELCCTRKQVVKLERSIASLEKQNAQLQQELDAVLTEKHDLECRIKRLDRKSEETKSSMVILQTEIDIRKSEVVSEHKTNEALTQHNQELCDIIEKCIINIERLKLEKAMLWKFYRDKMNKGESLQGINLNRSLRSNSFSEYAGVPRKMAERRRVSDVTARYVPGTKQRPFNSPKLLRMLREPVTPNLDGNTRAPKKNEVNLAAMILNRVTTPYLNKQDQRSLLDMTPPVELGKVPILSPQHLCDPATSSSGNSIASEIIHEIFQKAMSIVQPEVINGYSTPDSTDSPPVMYVVGRTPAASHCEVPSPTTPFSPKMNDSSDEYFFYDMMSGSEVQNENLLDEMAKATVCGIDEESEFEESTVDLREKGGSDGTPDGPPKTFVTEVHLKLDEYMDLEQKCEVLEQKIEELESENSRKDIRIIDLNNEIEQLRQRLSVEDENNIKSLRKRIDELERERNAYLAEKRKLAEEIKILNEEKVILRMSKEELLLKIVEYEKTSSGDHKSHLPSEYLSSKLRDIDKELIQTKEKCSSKEEDLECIKIDYERVKSTMETYQKLNKNLSSKNSLLQKEIYEKEKQLEDNLNEIVQLREDSGNLKEQIYKLNVQLGDFKRITSNLEIGLIQKESELERMEEKLDRNERTIEDMNSTLKIKELERNKLVKEIQEQLEEKNKCLEEILSTKEETKSEIKQTLEDTKRKLQQEIKKQEYLCEKFVALENELIEEKNSSKVFKENCESLQEDIHNFKETLTRLAEQLTSMEDQNRQLSLDNLNLYKSYEDKTKEIQSLIETKNFIAKRNEELLQDNADIVQKYDIVTKELGSKMALLDDMKRKLKEIDQLRMENKRIKNESDEILQKMRELSGDDVESDQIDSYSRKEGGGLKGREKRFGRRTNFDKLSAWNAKLEEKNAALSEQVAELRERLEKEIEAKNSMVARTNTVRDILYERRIRLGRATESAVDIWRPTLEKYIVKELFEGDPKPKDEIPLFMAPLDEEMWQLKHQIHATTVLLSHLTSFMNRQMLKKSESTQTEPEHSLALHRIGDVSTTSMEETFATLVLTYTVDKDLLLQRFHGKKIQLGEFERSLGEAVSTLTLYLERNAGGLDVSNFMSSILQLCTQVSIAAVQYGSLRQQTELTAAAEMMVNYVANLRQENELLNQQLSLVGTTTTALDRIEYQTQEEKIEISVSHNETRRFLSCAKATCIMFTLSVFVLVASLVLNTDAVFKIHRCPPPT